MIKKVFSSDMHDLGGAFLLPLTPEAASGLAERLVQTPPWSVMNYASGSMKNYLVAPDAACRRYAIVCDGVLAGAVAIRWPWLKGPYLELLGLSPEFQGRGLGAAVMAWMEHEARAANARWMWLLASSFNARAITFYERLGFETVTALDDLVADGFTEIMMRKRCAPCLEGEPKSGALAVFPSPAQGEGEGSGA